MIINIDLVYPVGSIYFSMNSTNPSKYFGGTWTQISQGRCLVGVDTTQTEFYSPNKTGGGKTHKHISGVGADTNGIYLRGDEDKDTVIVRENRHYKQLGSFSQYVAGARYVYTYEESSLQPYLTCYIWQRTA